MNTFQRHSKEMAELVRDLSRARFSTGLESQYAQTIELADVDPDYEVLASTLDPEDEVNQVQVNPASWAGSVSEDTPSLNEELQAALDSYELEDEISDLNHLYEKNEDKIDQLNELKDQIQINWNEGVDGSDVVALNTGAEAFLREYSGKKIPLKAAMEAVDAKTAALGVAGLAALSALIWKIWTLIKSRAGKGGGSSKAQDIADEKIESGKQAVARFAPKSNTIIKMEDIENIFDERDGPVDFIRANKNKTSVTAEDFANAYMKEVIYARANNDDAMRLAIHDPNEMRRLGNKIDACNKVIPTIIKLITEYSKDVRNALSTERFSTTLDAEHSEEIKSLNKIQQHLDDISDTFSKVPRNLNTSQGITWKELGTIMSTYERIKETSDDTNDVIKSAERDLERMQTAIKSSSADIERKSHAHGQENKIREWMTMLANIQNYTNKIGGTRVKLSVEYEKFGKALDKATAVGKKSSSDDK